MPGHIIRIRAITLIALSLSINYYDYYSKNVYYADVSFTPNYNTICAKQKIQKI